LVTANQYLQSGEYLWNAGIFVWRAATILNAFKALSPDIFQILESTPGIYNTAAEAEFIQTNYPKTPNISIDYAILEKSPAIYTLPTDMGWSDLGTWVSLHEESEKDEAGNFVQTETAVLTNVKNTLVRTPEGKLTVIDGLENYIVVDEGNVLLIYPKNKEQEIKAVTVAVDKKWAGNYS